MTIHVNPDSCTGCGVCSSICLARIISPPDAEGIPRIPEEKDEACMKCGQCVAFCPSGSLTLGSHPDQETLKAWNGEELTPELMSRYLKSRRSTRQFRPDIVPRETINAILDAARYAASGGNRQPVQWLVVHDPESVRQVAYLSIDYMRTLVGTAHPFAAYFPTLLSSWENGIDVICRGAPHLVIPHIPQENPLAPVDGIIALTHFDLVSPVYGIGTCWAGFVTMAASAYQPLQKFLGIPEGRIPAYAMMFGYPRFKPSYIPERNPLTVSWI
jgi:nitroreductase/NAD-dependent dihydropyrimidine dehydrogenase PreA subunit